MSGKNDSAQHNIAKSYGAVEFRWSLGPFDQVDGWANRLQELYAYWRSLPKDTVAGVPLRSRFDPFAVRSAIGWIWLCDAEGTPLRLRYRLVGTSIAEVVQSDATGKWMDELTNSHASRSVDMSRFEATIQHRDATYSKGPPVFDPREIINAVEVLCVPLTSSGEMVDQLLCCSYYHSNIENNLFSN